MKTFDEAVDRAFMELDTGPESAMALMPELFKNEALVSTLDASIKEMFDTGASTTKDPKSVEHFFAICRATVYLVFLHGFVAGREMARSEAEAVIQ